jgi:4-hydroxy-2-oxoheptanedioate aldolase
MLKQVYSSTVSTYQAKYIPPIPLATEIYIAAMTIQPISTPTAHTTTVQNPRLRLLNKLRSGEKPLMTFIAIPSVRHAQIIALTGLDGVIIDCEHG